LRFRVANAETSAIGRKRGVTETGPGSVWERVGPNPSRRTTDGGSEWPTGPPPKGWGRSGSSAAFTLSGVEDKNVPAKLSFLILVPRRNGSTEPSAIGRRFGGGRRTWTEREEVGERRTERWWEADEEVVRGGRTGGGRTADPQAVVGDAARVVGTGARIGSAELQREKRRTSATDRTFLTRINV